MSVVESDSFFPSSLFVHSEVGSLEPEPELEVIPGTTRGMAALLIDDVRNIRLGLTLGLSG